MRSVCYLTWGLFLFSVILTIEVVPLISVWVLINPASFVEKLITIWTQICIAGLVAIPVSFIGVTLNDQVTDIIDQWFED